ncbi:Origin recognition complex subunit 5, partial [Cladochytrium tenue]
MDIDTDLSDDELLVQRFPGRRPQMELLLRYLDLAHTGFFGSVHVEGLPGTGKTAVVRAALEARARSLPTALVDAVMCYTPALLFESALDALQAATADARDDVGAVPATTTAKPARCSQLSEFAASVGSLFADFAQGRSQERAFCIVIDNAERLRDFGPTFPVALMNIGEQAGCNVVVIFISSVPWRKWGGAAGSSSPSATVEFPQYTRAEARDILALDCPAGEDRALFAIFVNLVQEILQKPCRDLKELRYIVGLLYPKYIEPVKAGLVKPTESTKLYRNISFYFKEVLDKLYLRTLSSSEWGAASKADRQTVAVPL